MKRFLSRRSTALEQLLPCTVFYTSAQSAGTLSFALR